MSVGTNVAVVTEDDRAAVRAVSPLAADHELLCNEAYVVPVGMLAARAGRVPASSDEGRILRKFLRDWPGHAKIGGGAENWILVFQDEDTLVFAARKEPIGFRTVVTLVRQNGQFAFSARGDVSLSFSDLSERAEYGYRGVTSGRSVELDWDCGRMDGAPIRVLARTEVLETPSEVHFLLISVPNPALTNPSGLGTGDDTSAKVVLDEPLGARALYNDCKVPAERIPTVASDSAAYRRHQRAIRQQAAVRGTLPSDRGTTAGDNSLTN